MQWTTVYVAKKNIGCVSVEYPSSGVSVTHEQELTTFSSTQNGASLDSDHSSSSGSHSATDTPPIHAGVTINSSEGPSQNTSALVQSNNSGQSGLSMFQGYWVLSFLLLLQYSYRIILPDTVFYMINGLQNVQDVNMVHSELVI